MADFQQVKASVSFPDAINRLGLQVKQTNNEWRGACPVCQGSDRALSISTEKGFRCWTSNAKGSVIDLVAHVRGLSLKQAAEWLLPSSRPTCPESVPEPQKKPHTTPAPIPSTAENGRSFDRAKYQAGLDRKHELLKDVPPDLCERADIGVSNKGVHRGLVSVPLYDKQSGAFLCYIGVPSVNFPKLKKPSAEALPPNVVPIKKTG